MPAQGGLEFASGLFGAQREELGAGRDDQGLAGDQTIDVAPNEGILVGAIERHRGLGVGRAGWGIPASQGPKPLAVTHRTYVERKTLTRGRDIATRAARHRRQARLRPAGRRCGAGWPDIGRAALGQERWIEQDGVLLDQASLRPHGLDQEI
jgi:hypothetical protein